MTPSCHLPPPCISFNHDCMFLFIKSCTYRYIYISSQKYKHTKVLDHIVAHGRLSEKETRKYVRQLISAVDHLHKAGVIHRCVVLSRPAHSSSLSLSLCLSHCLSSHCLSCSP